MALRKVCNVFATNKSPHRLIINLHEKKFFQYVFGVNWKNKSTDVLRAFNILNDILPKGSSRLLGVRAILSQSKFSISTCLCALFAPSAERFRHGGVKWHNRAFVGSSSNLASSLWLVCVTRRQNGDICLFSVQIQLMLPIRSEPVW